MSRYIKSFEGHNAETLKDKIETFLKENRFTLQTRKNEYTWMRHGMGCWHCVIIKYEVNKIELTAFIVYHKFEYVGLNLYRESKEETESTIKGFFGGFGKWPIQRTIKRLQKIISENI